MILRALICWSLALSLAIGSAGLALARHAPQVAGFIALCTTAGETQVAVDAEGNPIGIPHRCADCTVNALQPQASALPVWRALERSAEATLSPPAPRATARLRAHPPRGPPVPVSAQT
jgi:hypothetical protein